jgi:hypothetical protein
VDRRAQRRPLDHRAALERPGESVTLEALDPGEEADVHRRRVLGLDPAGPLEGLRQRPAARLEQKLAGEQSSIELTRGQRPLVRRHQARMALR